MPRASVRMGNSKSFAFLRIAFGVVWAIDAFFKWQPGFFGNFVAYLQSGAEGQPMLIQQWIHFWIALVGVDPYAFALVVAISETLLALSLLSGIFTDAACYGGILFSFVIWSTAEGFGGPYTAGSTDIGSAIIYVFVFVALLLGRSGTSLSIEPRIRAMFK